MLILCVDFSAELDTCLDSITEVMGVTVTVRKVAPGAMNTTTMARAETTTDLSVKANRTDTTQEHTPAGDGRQIVENARYEIQASLLASLGTPARGWRIVESSVVREIVTVDMDADRKNYLIRTRRTL